MGAAAIIKEMNTQKAEKIPASTSSAVKATAATGPPASAGQGPVSSTLARMVDSQVDSVKPTGTFDHTVLIGDSRTEGLEIYDGLGNAAYYAAKGLTVSTVFTKPVIEVDGKKVTVMQALSQKQFDRVYIMLGVNELGWSSSQTFIQEYGKMIDTVRKDQPKAKIYVQSILPVTAKKAGMDKTYSLKNIVSHNKMIQNMTEEKGVYYLSVDASVSDSKGYLPDDASVDGVHLNSKYCKKWCEFLKKNT